MEVRQIDPPITDEERDLLAELAALKRDYERAAEPIVEKLAILRARRVPTYYVMPADIRTQRALLEAENARLANRSKGE